jgi:hypothetical protein
MTTTKNAELCSIGNRPVPVNLEYANAANRIAGTNEQGSGKTLTTDQLYQLARQQDDDSIWMLMAITPSIVWQLVSTTGNETVGGNLTVEGTSDLQGNVANSTGDLTIDDNLAVTGTSDLQGNVANSTGNVVVDDNLDVTGEISNTSGILTINPTTYTRIGDAGTSSRSLADDDLFCSARLEVDGAAYLEGAVTITAGAIFNNNIALSLGSGANCDLRYNTNQTNNSLFMGLPSTSNTVLLCEKADVGTNFGRANYTDPTLVLQSADATSPTQYIATQHNQTDMVQIVGTGGSVTHNEAPVVLVDDGSFNLPASSSGRGFFMAGDNAEYAEIVWGSNGVATLVNNSTNVATADTDGNLCFIATGGTTVQVKNRLGASKSIVFNYQYTTSPTG